MQVLDRVDELLEATYRSSDLGNLADPLAETVYILLSRQTQEPVYQQVYRAIRTKFPMWIDVLSARSTSIAKVLKPAGLHKQRATQLKDLLKAVQADNRQRGLTGSNGSDRDLTLSYLQDWDDRDVERFLIGLPGIGPKSARCVMAYSLGRARFAVDTHVRRIMSRIGVVKSQGRKLDHDPFQDVVPASIRKRLHINLVHHGRAVCRAAAPRCSGCSLISFCDHARKKPEFAHRVLALDLFAGAGGMGTGFQQAGFGIGLAVEKDRHAAQTYRLNNPGVPVLEADVSALAPETVRSYLPRGREIDAIIAGPPCQGYSAAGRREPEDRRNQLFRSVTRLGKQLGVRVIVFENVPGVKKVNGTDFLKRILASLRAQGYAADSHLLRASDFGVPQNRLRYFILAQLRGKGAAPSAPVPTHAFPQGGATGGRLSTPSVAEVLSDLPRFGPGVLAEVAEHQGRVLLNASTMRHSDRVVNKIAKIKPGKGPISYYRLESGLARTIVAGHRALPVHPFLDRTISVREAARIQGFPDDYFFCGPRSEQPLQVANAVPVPMAESIGRHLLTLWPSESAH